MNFSAARSFSASAFFLARSLSGSRPCGRRCRRLEFELMVRGTRVHARTDAWCGSARDSRGNACPVVRGWLRPAPPTFSAPPCLPGPQAAYRGPSQTRRRNGGGSAKKTWGEKKGGRHGQVSVAGSWGVALGVALRACTLASRVAAYQRRFVQHHAPADGARVVRLRGT